MKKSAIFVGLLPPRTIAKLDKLPPSKRREYAQELKGRYEYRTNHLRAAARDMAEEWVERQGAHLDKILEALDEYLES